MSRFSACSMILASCIAAGCGSTLSVDRTKLPTPKPDVAYQPKTPTVFTTANEIEVWQTENRKAPLFHFALILPTGSASDPADKAGLLSLTADLMDEGAGDYSALELADAFQNLATDFAASVSTDSVTFYLSGLQDEFDASLALLAQIIQKPHLSQTEFERVSQKHIASALAGEANLQQTAQLAYRYALYGDGYAGNAPTGNRDTLAKISLDDVKAAYAQAIKPKGAIAIMEGAMNQAELTTALNKYFSDWTGSPEAKSIPVATQSSTEHHLVFVPHPGATQSFVALVRRAPGASDPARYAEELFNEPFAGKFTSRVNMKIREEKGYSYGARGGFNRWKDAGVYGLYTQVDSRYTRATIDEMLALLLKVVSDEPLNDAEVSEAQSDLRLSFPSQFETIENRMDMLQSFAQTGRPADAALQYLNKIAAVTLDEAQEQARTFARPEDFVIVVAGTPELLESLQGLGHPIQLFTPQGRPASEQ